MERGLEIKGDFKPKIEARESKTDWGARTFGKAKVKFGLKSEAKLSSLREIRGVYGRLFDHLGDRRVILNPARPKK